MSPATASSRRPPDGRIPRLLQERERLEMLAASSSCLRIAGIAGDPPTQFDLQFTLGGEAMGQLHVERRPETPAICRMTFTDDFPAAPPELLWLSRTWHPNITPSGVMPWRALELVWDPRRHVDDVVARLWEVASWKRFETSRAVNAAAARWFAAQHQVPILDARGLRDLAEHHQSVVVGYRRDSRGLRLFPLEDDAAGAATNAPLRASGDGESDEGIVFLDELRPEGSES